MPIKHSGKQKFVVQKKPVNEPAFSLINLNKI